MSKRSTAAEPSLLISHALAYLTAHADDMVHDLKTYVRWETPSDDKELLDRAFPLILEWIYARIGMPVREEIFESADLGNIAVLDFGHTPESVLLAHYDTVWPAGTTRAWPLQFDAEYLSGPGVFDMKAGLVQAVWGIRSLQQTAGFTPHTRLILTGDEETGSHASRAIIETKTNGMPAVYVFEGSSGGALKTGRKGVGLFTVNAMGIEAHAGLNPLDGASAVHAIAEAITQIVGFADHAAGTTVNAGLVTGGSRSNVSAGRAQTQVDVRVTSIAEMARIDRCFTSLTTTDPRVTLTVDTEWNRPPFERTTEIGMLFARAARVGRLLGIDLTEVSVGGASDANFVAALGIPVLDGLGAVGDGAHARHEHASRSGLVERAALAAGLLLPDSAWPTPVPSVAATSVFDESGRAIAPAPIVSVPRVPVPIADQASVAATRAANIAGVRIREETEINELREVSELLVTIWGTGRGESPMSAELLRGLGHAGSAVSAAYDRNGGLCGAAVLIVSPGSVSAYSLIAGVLSANADQGVGFALKQHQRAWALERGIDEISWTFDPLVSRNARFNLTKLGAHSVEYTSNFYGAMSGAINANDESDRLTALWPLTTQLAVECSEGRASTVELPAFSPDQVRDVGPDGEPAVIEAEGALWCRVPTDIVALRRQSPRIAAEWRQFAREIFTTSFSSGHIIRGVTRAGWYRLETEGQ
ncbi:M20/M25/M40 family metallo-hydrolase [Cryobacterium sp. CG_9.6]|uniref:M20/M25/M40 family metallo-hydrolase n=1 Tax=Cryobacterium sp. CG_9.6 TaxID=2760710 RepID=UPI002475DEB3|nr:M20/M25/M40 family metallo-hydrolase [Cryobacterium sp. CG_9.6]MDH6236093.1 putative GNAT superfamily acetyltransferase/acetylornithine deacetylase/succinyl-diaminopimelate desuccinylase-like protein [Cryobacterium sp. CG_9.6]